MLIPLRSFRQARPQNAIIAVLLCYAMIVQGYAAHAFSISASRDASHQLCITNPSSLEDEIPPTKSGADLIPHAFCCLIFGSGDVPRATVHFSVITFNVSPALYPGTEFVNLIDKRISFTQSRPRAPPPIG